MALIRTIVVALIAISVAVLPAIGLPIISPSPVEVTMADHADMPCCPHNTQDHFKSTTCILKCVALAGVVLPATGIARPCLAGGSPLISVDDTLHEFLRSPPTRPPPV
jgi:hypothetical protein